MQDFEKLGVFYLGREYDADAGRPTDALVLYDSKDLLTHGVCVGMTGSGKTGLCICLLEEAAIDGIPALVIDPKGDLANLLLTFPNLSPEDFLPWVSEEEAARAGSTPAEFAKSRAELWKKGLAEWGQDGARIQRLKDSADFAIYTPGSSAGIPVSVLRSLSLPSAVVLEDAELMREEIQATSSALLSLLGVDADPLTGREHILLANLVEHAWRAGEGLDLPRLVQKIQSPPMQRVGVVDLESFFPAKDRFSLAMRLNNLFASPGFSLWTEGVPLDVGALLYTDSGKPRIAILSIAHLADAERMFFVSLLLSRVLAWTRAQPGTTSLRALLYMDEIAGYFPPVSNPPSKGPLLALLKQARAFGLGVVLATQNPVDLDYKGLSNAGTWLLGRLQTERDKARVLDALESAAATGGGRFDRAAVDKLLSGLSQRVFLLHNVHESGPVLLHARWALSYLSGPLTRSQIKRLMDDRPEKRLSAQEGAGASPRAAAAEPATLGATSRPVLPPDVPERFLPVEETGPEGAPLVYEPKLVGFARVRFADAKLGIDVARDLALVASIPSEVGEHAWDDCHQAELDSADLATEPHERAAFAPLPPKAAKAKNLANWKKKLAIRLQREQCLELFRCPSLGMTSAPEESERDFRIRLAQAAREERDRIAEDLRKKFAPRKAALEEKIRKAMQVIEREAEQASQQKYQSWISMGTTILGAFLGRKTISATTLGRAGTAARSVGRASKEAQDVARAKENLAALEKQQAELEESFQKAVDAAAARIDPATESLETVRIKPKRDDVEVADVVLAWAPRWQSEA